MKKKYPYCESLADRRPPRGFTLLEIMIVGVLTSVLMLGVWSLFRTWGRLYERGERRVQAAQLIRSLSDQFADDVRAVAHVAPPRQQRSRGGSGSRSNRGTSSRKSGAGHQALVGGADWLVLDVLQPPNPFLLSSGDSGAPADDAGAETAVLYAPELQRVVYTFQPPRGDALDSLSPAVTAMAESDDTELVNGNDGTPMESPSGLLRMVVPVEQFDQLAAGDSALEGAGRSLGLSSGGIGSGGSDAAAWQLRELVMGPSDADGASSVYDTTAAATPDSSVQDGMGMVSLDKVPEVIWLEFRYYDGSAWTNSWDSRAEGALPVAVEMRFELKKERSSEETISSDGETELVDDGMSDAALDASLMPAESSMMTPTDSALDTAGEETPYYRCFVYLESRRERGK